MKQVTLFKTVNRVGTGRCLESLMIIEFKVKFRTKPSGWVMRKFPWQWKQKSSKLDPQPKDSRETGSWYPGDLSWT